MVTKHAIENIYTEHYKLSIRWYFDQRIEIRITDENKNSIEKRNVGNIHYFVPIPKQLSGFILEPKTKEEKHFVSFMPYFIQKASQKYIRIHGL